MKISLKRQRNHDCFTLLELVIVCVIIAILASLGVGYYRKVIIKTKAGKAKHAISLIAEAEKMYRMSYGVYWPVGAGAVNAGIGTNITGMNIGTVDNDTDFNYSVTGGAANVDINANNPTAIGTCGAGSLIILNLPTGSWIIPGCYK